MSKNKIFAVSFLSLACFFFFGYYLYLETAYSWAYFRSTSWVNILAFALEAIIYLILLSCNIRNDDFAYTGIALFVSMKFFEYIRAFFYGQINVLNAFSSGSPLSVLLSVLYTAFLALEAGVGIALYVFIIRYRRGVANFLFVRVLSIVFAVILTLTGLTSSLIFFQGASLTWQMLFGYLAIPLAEACAGVGIVFTLERLRRC